jgi:hypothetical protein
MTRERVVELDPVVRTVPPSSEQELERLAAKYNMTLHDVAYCLPHLSLPPDYQLPEFYGGE